MPPWVVYAAAGSAIANVANETALAAMRSENGKGDDPLGRATKGETGE
jgi:hypothetical protein